jgi:transcriptional regulator with XRE-family HTH domain
MGVSADPIVPEPDVSDLDRQIGAGLRRLRRERGWSLEQLVERSRVSRASLSRLENGEVSATAQVLGKLAAAYGFTASRLLHRLEGAGQALMRREDQPFWQDSSNGFMRRAVSPPGDPLAGEVIEGQIPAGTRIAYDVPPRAGLEHHLVLLDGALTLSIEGERHVLRAGDCLRYVLFGASHFETPPSHGARYLLFMV